MQQLSYTVEPSSFIRYWMVSSVLEKPWHAPLEPMVIESYYPGFSAKDREGKELVSTAKAHFVAHTTFLSDPHPPISTMDQIYWPLDTDRVDFSGMWIYPTELRFYGRTTVHSDRKRLVDLEIIACGAAKVWCNGAVVVTFSPWQSNIEASMVFTVSLEKGDNELIVGCCDYGERNILLKFALRSRQERLLCSLPVSVDRVRLDALQSYVQALHLERLSYSDGMLTFRCEASAPCSFSLTVKAGQRTWLLGVAEGARSIVWCSPEELGLGGHQVEISATVSSITLSSSLFVEVYPASIEVGSEKSVSGRKALYIPFFLQHSEAGLDREIASLALGRAIEAEAIEADLVRVEQRSDCADFRAERFAWILARHADALPAALKKRLEQALLNFRYWYDEPGNDAMWFFSENHALAFHTAALISGQLFAARTFTNSNMSGLEQQQKAKVLLVQWFDKLLKSGYNEWNSANYIPVEVESYLILLSLASDPQIRDLARQALDYTFTLFAVMCHRGMLSGASGRVYARDLLGSRVQLANGLTYIAWGAGKPAIGSAALLLALCPYEPPEHLQAIACWQESALFEDRRTQGTWAVSTVVCKNKDFILATSSSPREGRAGSQEHLFNLVVGDWQGRLWINHPGELKVFGTRRPGYFTGNALTPKVSQHASSALITYRYARAILPLVEADFTHLIIDLDAFDEVRRGPRTLVGARQGCYVGIWVANGLDGERAPSLKGRELTSVGITNTWYVRIATTSDCSWQEFVSFIETVEPTIEPTRVVVDDWQWGPTSYEAMEPVDGEERG